MWEYFLIINRASYHLHFLDFSISRYIILLSHKLDSFFTSYMYRSASKFTCFVYSFVWKIPFSPKYLSLSCVIDSLFDELMKLSLDVLPPTHFRDVMVWTKILIRNYYAIKKACVHITDIHSQNDSIWFIWFKWFI